MRVNITGLTDMTISFSGIGLILRGKTTAKNIDIKSDDQMREIIGMKNAKLISIVTEEESTPVIINPPESIKIILEDVKEEDTEEIESPIIDRTADVVKDPTPTTMVKRGEVKAEDPKNNKKSMKKISRVEDSEENNNGEDVVIMMNGMAKKGKSRRSAVKDLPESDATRASIEALKQLEEEENGEAEEEANRKPIDEESLPLNERMGNKATVAFGSRNTEEVTMKNTILPEAEQTAAANKFIPLKDKTSKQKEKERLKSAFIDNRNIEDEPDEILDNKDDDNDDLIET